MATQRNRRLVYSLAIVLVWLGFIVEGSHALFSDTAVLAGSTINSGSTDLLISNSQSGSSSLYADSRPGFSYTLSPGMVDERYLFLKNAAPSEIPLDIDMFASSLTTTNPELASRTTITLTPVDETGAPKGTPVGATLSNLQARHVNLGVTIPAATSQRFKIGVGISTDFSEQGKSLGYDLVFTGTQHLPS